MNVANMQGNLHRSSYGEPNPIDPGKPCSPQTNAEMLTGLLDTPTSWPDETLNRLLLKLDSIDTDRIDEVECLELLFYFVSRRGDARYLAEIAVERYGSLAGVYQCSADELHEVLGLDWAATSALALTKLNMKCIVAPRSAKRRAISSYQVLIDYLSLTLRGSEQQKLLALHLDEKNNLIKEEEISRGTVDSVPTFPREIARRAIMNCSSAVVLAHNHLSDDPTPSPHDVRTTLAVKRLLEQHDIVLNDHVIIARSQCYSMDQEGDI